MKNPYQMSLKVSIMLDILNIANPYLIKEVLIFIIL